MVQKFLHNSGTVPLMNRRTSACTSSSSNLYIFNTNLYPLYHALVCRMDCSHDQIVTSHIEASNTNVALSDFLCNVLSRSTKQTFMLIAPLFHTSRGLPRLQWSQNYFHRIARYQYLTTNNATFEWWLMTCVIDRSFGLHVEQFKRLNLSIAGFNSARLLDEPVRPTRSLLDRAC